MIRLLKGTIETVYAEEVVLLTGGVGYQVLIGPRLAQELLAHLGQSATLHIYSHVKEDAFQLFGFLSSSDREVFVQLLSVSGVGPKTAVQVIDRGAEAVAQAIRTSDVEFFQGIPRLGKKSAQKIIVELQSKLGKITELDLTPESSATADLREALVNMGYAEARVRDVLSRLDTALDAAQALSWSLRELNQGGRV